MQELDRDRPVQPRVPAVADLGHSATAQNPPQLVAVAKKFRRLHSVNASAPALWVPYPVVTGQ